MCIKLLLVVFAFLMLAAATTEIIFGIAAERKGLEKVAAPLSEWNNTSG